MKSRHKETNRVFAIKKIEKLLIRKVGMVKQVINEIKIMYSLNHENIIKLVNHFEDEKYCYLVMEFASNGQVYSKMLKQASKRFSEKEVARVKKKLIFFRLFSNSVKPLIIYIARILYIEILNLRICFLGKMII